MQVTLREAETQLSALGKRAWAGERIVIAQDGESYLELIPHQKERKRRPGRFKGKIKISGDFTETPADVIGSFYGETESSRVHLINGR